MDDKDRAKFERLKSIRLDDGSPVVWDGENPVHNFKHAVFMAERAKLLYRWTQDGRDFQYRIAEPAPVLTCKLSEACDVLCNLVLDNYPSRPTELVEEWEPTPEYAALLEEEAEESESDAEPEAGLGEGDSE
jgi:hypothetical protein